MINLNTTTWMFETDTNEIIQVIEQYANTYAALGGAYKVMKKALEVEPFYVLYTEPLSLEVEGKYREGIAVTSDESRVGIFIPDAELEGRIEPILVEGGRVKPLSALSSLL